jgi:prepilin peptidase CpaA
MRVLGAGDVKLMGMVGAFLGLPETLPALLCVFLAGGLAALAFVVVHRSVPQLAANLRAMVQGTVLSALTGQPFGGMTSAVSVGKLPYGVSISAGSLLYLVAHQLGYL